MTTHKKNKWIAHVYIAEGHPYPLAVVSCKIGNTTYYDLEGCRQTHLFDAKLAADDYAELLGNTHPKDVKTKMTADQLPKGCFATDKEIADDLEAQRQKLEERISIVEAMKNRTLSPAQEKRLEKILKEMSDEITGAPLTTVAPLKKLSNKNYKPKH